LCKYKKTKTSNTKHLTHILINGTLNRKIFMHQTSISLASNFISSSDESQKPAKQVLKYDIIYLPEMFELLTTMCI